MGFSTWPRTPDDRRDIPVHRPSVGAMGLTSDPLQAYKTFKPYVYRGTREEQFPETEPEPKPKPKRKRKPRRYVPYVPPRPLDINDVDTWGNWRKPPPLPPPPPPPEPEPEPDLRPSPGWEPMTGEDIDAILAEM